MSVAVNSVIYNPLEEFVSKYRSLHAEHTNQFFEALVRKFGVNIEENRKTVKQYDFYKEHLAK